MVEESEEEPPGQRQLLFILLLLCCGSQGVRAQEDGVTGEALCHKIVKNLEFKSKIRFYRTEHGFGFSI